MLQGVLGEANGEVSDAHTADDFATFFQNKVDSVRSSTATTSLYDVLCRSTLTISKLAPVTAEEVEKMIGSSPNKLCQLDSAPTWLVKDMRTLLSPPIAVLFNLSLATGCFPTEFKEAVVHPRLKKTGLVTSERKNYRLVSNLSFLSKLLERVVQTRLQAFLDTSGLMPEMQSTY